jgi:hypothetical protein
MQEQIFVQVRFKDTVTVKGMDLEYSDAIYYTQEQYSKLDLDAHEAIKKERIDNWKNAIENPPAAVEPTKEQLEAEQVSIDEQVAALQARKTELTDKISTMSFIG